MYGSAINADLTGATASTFFGFITNISAAIGWTTGGNSYELDGSQSVTMYTGDSATGIGSDNDYIIAAGATGITIAQQDQQSGNTLDLSAQTAATTFAVAADGTLTVTVGGQSLTALSSSTPIPIAGIQDLIGTTLAATTLDYSAYAAGIGVNLGRGLASGFDRA